MTSPEQQPRRGMKAKTIRKVLRNRMDEWFSSIEDEALRADVEKHTIVTGGCIASMLLGETVNDYDVYFTNKKTVQKLAQYYVNRFEPIAKRGIPCAVSVDDSLDRIRIIIKSAGVASEGGTEKPYEYFETQSDDDRAGQYAGEIMRDSCEIEDTYEETKAAVRADDCPDKPRYRPVFLSTNAITLSERIQIVLRFYGEPDEIHKNYDFVHCTNYWRSSTGELTLRPAAMEALLARELRYVGSLYPICSLVRLRKFIRRGWTVNAGQILKMAMQISELDLKSHSVLEEQLTGVDAAYFAEIVSRVREKDSERVNSAYLVEIIDRMF